MDAMALRTLYLNLPLDIRRSLEPYLADHLVSFTIDYEGYFTIHLGEYKFSGNVSYHKLIEFSYTGYSPLLLDNGASLHLPILSYLCMVVIKDRKCIACFPSYIYDILCRKIRAYL